MKTIVAAAGSFQSGVLSALFPLSSCALTRFTLGTLVANAIGHDGVISGFRVYLESNTYSASRTIFLRKNGVNTAISLVIPAGATGVFVKSGLGLLVGSGALPPVLEPADMTAAAD